MDMPCPATASATRYIKPRLSFALYSSPSLDTYLLYPTVPVISDAHQNRMIGELRTALNPEAAVIVADQDYTLRMVPSTDRRAPWMLELKVTALSDKKKDALTTAINTLFPEKALTR